MPMMDYVIGGMERSFKLKLFLYALCGGAGRAVAWHNQCVPR